MKYRVVLTENAKRNLQSYDQHAAKAAPKTAADWLDRFEEAHGRATTTSLACQNAVVDNRK